MKTTETFDAGITLIEAVRAADATGGEAHAPNAWRVRLIRAGLSKNGNNYPLRVLHEAAPLYEGVRALARNDDEHLAGKGKHAKNVVGWFTGVTPSAEGLDATFNVVESATWLKTMLWDSWGRGKKDIVGFSHVAEARAAFSRVAGSVTREVQKIASVDFVDVVVTPSAGGEIVGLAESTGNERSETMMMEHLLKLIEALSPAQYKELDTANVTEAQVVEILESIKRDAASAPKGGALDVGASVLAQVSEALKDVRGEVAKISEASKTQAAREKAVVITEAVFSKSGLPAAALDRIVAQVNGTDAPATKEQVEEFVAAEAKYLGITQGWSGPGSSTRRVAVTRDASDKWKAALDGLVSGQQRVKLSEAQGDTIEAYTSLREAFRDGTGLDPLEGGLTSPLVNVSEAAIQSTTYGGALGDSIRRSMQAEYAIAPYNSWRKVFPAVSVPDFRKQYRPQVGAFPTLSTVSQNAAYGEFSTHMGDFTPEYTVQKYGNLQALTMETIVNDDIGFVRRIPIELGRAAARTVDYYAWYPLVNNTALTYHVGGGTADVTTTYFGPFSATADARGAGNLGSSALSASAVLATRLAIMKNTVNTSGTGGAGGPRHGIAPKFICVPLDLEAAAYEICYAGGKPILVSTGTNTNAAAGTPTTQTGTIENGAMPNFINRVGLEHVVMPQATDVNDWYVLTDSKDVPTVEVGFLGGRQEPELFIADGATSDAGQITGGGVFTSDRIVYKVRLIFGTCVLDYRGMYRHTVA